MAKAKKDKKKSDKKPPTLIDIVTSRLEEQKAAVAKLRKTYGGSVLMSFTGGAVHGAAKHGVIPTGSVSLDHAIGVGGYPRGRIIEIYGPESCVVGGSVVNFTVWTEDGKRINHKGGTIKRLWERFHNVAPDGDARGKSRRQPDNITFTAPSINEEGRILHNRIEDVFHVGTRETFRITTICGRELVATAEHKLFTGGSYVPVSGLRIGDTVYVHTKTPFTCEYSRKTDRQFIYVRGHGVAGVKVVRAIANRTTGETRDYAYYRLARARAVVEASLNGLSFDDYVARLNVPNLEGLRFLRSDEHVHHIDENVLNDSIENLVVLSASEHGRQHAFERHNNLRFMATPTAILSIEPAGPTAVYDLKMASPYHNYVVQDFVTHNSGKTTLTLHAIAEAQKLGHFCAMIDAEHALDMRYATALGVQTADDKLLVSQPDYGEQAFEVVKELASAGTPLIIVDSVAALVPKSELEGEIGDATMGKHARLMSQACRVLTAVAERNASTIIFINQLRSKIGVLFGSPEVTTGGNALKYYASLRIDIRRRKQIMGKDGEAYGNDVEIKVVKNKCAPPFKTAHIEILWGRGINSSGDLINAAVTLGVIAQSGSSYLFNGTRLAQGYASSYKFLDDNPDIFRLISAEVAKAMGEDVINSKI